MEIVNNVLKKFSYTDLKNGVLYVPEGVTEIQILPNSINEKTYKQFKKIVMPSTLKSIGPDSFEDLENLKEVEFNEGIEKIGQYAFSGTGIKKLALPDSIKEISEYAFSSCKKLTNAKLPSSLKRIKNGLFNACYNLENIVLPTELEIIDDFAFRSTDVKNIKNFPDSIKVIKDSAFFGTSISNISIPKELKLLSSSALANTKVDVISINKKEILKNKQFIFIENNLPNFKAFEDDNKYYLCYDLRKAEKFEQKNFKQVNFLRTENEHSDFGNTDYLIGDCDKLYSKIKNIAKHQEINVNLVLKLQQDIQNGKDIEVSFYNKLASLNISKYIKDNVDILAYNLGMFEKPITETKITKSGKTQEVTTNYAQKALEFFKRIDFNAARSYFRGIDKLEFKKDFADFILDKDNIEKILEQEYITPGFIGKCYTHFEAVQETNKSHKGSQRQLKPTVEKFVSYFADNKFENVTEENKELASFIGKFYEEQEVFEVSKKILDWQQEKNVESNITKVDIVEEKLNNIEMLKNSIMNTSKGILKNLSEISEKNFTYEFLDKHSWLNMVLGKYCDCCAHLSGFGGGIAIASMVNPDVQNLVIRNSSNKIISKATLYINREQGYGVFNTFEVKQTISQSQRKYIYKKYMEAINEFVKVYNAENPNNKIKQINVGMTNNDLKEEIEEHNLESDVILKSIDYAKYAMLQNFHKGDWQDGQYVLYKETGEEKDI